MLPEGVDLEQSGSVVTLRVRVPELTHLQAEEMVSECLERMRCHHATYFIFDWEGVQFIASACLGPLISLLQDLEHVRGRVAMINCEDNVAFLFKVTRLDSIFGLFDDEKEAHEALAGY